MREFFNIIFQGHVSQNLSQILRPIKVSFLFSIVNQLNWL